MSDTVNCFGIPDTYKGYTIKQGPDDRFYTPDKDGSDLVSADSWPELRDKIDVMPSEVWMRIETADRSPKVGSRSMLILGCDAEGNVAKTSFANGHLKGEAWLMSTEEGLQEWQPILWAPLPRQFQDLDGRSYDSRRRST